MNVVHRNSAAALDTPPGIAGRKLHESGHALVIHLTLQPGAALAKHSAPMDALFYVLEGRGLAEIGEESVEAGEGTLVASRAGSMHSWRNLSEEPLRILVVKTPKPAAGP